MGLAITLAIVHAILSGVVLSQQDTISKDMMRNFLIVSIVVCLLIAGLCAMCMYKNKSSAEPEKTK